MCIDFEAENWLGNPTREEMLEHFYKVTEAENELLRFEVDRYRKNQAKLIEMLSAATIERNRLTKELAEANALISKRNIESYEQDRKIGSLQRIVSQRDEVMRMHGISEIYFGSPRTES